MIALVLGVVFVAACVIWALSWSIQIGGSIIVILFRTFPLLVKIILMIVVTLVGSVVWMAWFCVAPKRAMASLRKAQAEQKGPAHG